MPATAPHQLESARRARQLSELIDLGFVRAERPVESDAVRVDGGGWRLSETVPAMGTAVSLSILDRSRDRGEQAIGAAWQEMNRVVGLLNRFDESSAVAQLNRDGRLADAPDELMAVVAASRALGSVSAGAFDVTVAPVIDLLRSRRAAGVTTPPDDQELGEALERTGIERLHIDGRRLELTGDGMAVTFDGIAKGYVVDRVAAVLESHGVTDFLVNAGGDVRTAGTRDGRSPWRVAVRDPDRADRPAAVLAAGAGAVATSGGYEIFFDDDGICHHIVDAHSGRSPSSCRGVTVRARDTMNADALATTIFILGPRRGLALIEQLPGADCLILTEDGPMRSSGWLASTLRGREEPV